MNSDLACPVCKRKVRLVNQREGARTTCPNCTTELVAIKRENKIELARRILRPKSNKNASTQGRWPIFKHRAQIPTWARWATAGAILLILGAGLAGMLCVNRIHPGLERPELVAGLEAQNIPRADLPGNDDPAKKIDQPAQDDDPLRKSETDQEPAEPTIYERVLASTVWVICPRPDHLASTGTGSLIDREQRLIITNDHVVESNEDVTIYFPEFRDDELINERQYYRSLATKYPGKVVYRDRSRDLALVQLRELPASAKVIQLASASPRASETVHTVGNSEEVNLWTYTQGHVRSVIDRKKYKTEGGYEIEARVVVTDSAINKGDSGGPIVNDRGEMVAVVQSYAVDASLVSQCIDISEVRSLLEMYLTSLAR